MNKLSLRTTLVGALALAASVLAANSGAAQAGPLGGLPLPAHYSISTYAYAGDTFTQLLGINDHNLVVGYHGMTTNKGLVLPLPGPFVHEDFPFSAQTQVVAVNNAGLTGGFYVDTAGATHGFLDNNGNFATVDFPRTTFNQILGLNNRGAAAGYYQDSAGVFHAYIRGPIAGYEQLPIYNAQATGINDADVISGFAQPTSTTAYGFLMTGQSRVTLEFPGSTFTQAFGVNNNDRAVGSYVDGAGATHGFVYEGGAYQSFDVPGASSTTINGINNNGTITGFYQDAVTNNTIGFVAVPTA